MARLRVPTIATVTGEGGSGGALALAVADRVLMLENAIYTVISPEGCASIMWRDAAQEATGRGRAEVHRVQREGTRLRRRRSAPSPRAEPTSILPAPWRWSTKSCAFTWPSWRPMPIDELLRRALPRSSATSRSSTLPPNRRLGLVAAARTLSLSAENPGGIVDSKLTNPLPVLLVCPSLAFPSAEYRSRHASL